MNNLVGFAAGLLGALSVVLGAFGAHALKSRLSEDLMSAYQTGVSYHLMHSVALLALAILIERQPSTLLYTAATLMFAGIICFSGSLYLLTLTTMRWLGPVTPVGGLLLISAWICIAIAAWK